MNGANPEARTVRARIALAALGAVIAVAIASGCAGDGGEPPVVDYGTVLLRVAWPLNPTGPATVAVACGHQSASRLHQCFRYGAHQPLSPRATSSPASSRVPSGPRGRGAEHDCPALTPRTASRCRQSYSTLSRETARIRIVLTHE